MFDKEPAGVPSPDPRGPAGGSRPDTVATAFPDLHQGPERIVADLSALGAGVVREWTARLVGADRTAGGDDVARVELLRALEDPSVPATPLPPTCPC